MTRRDNIFTKIKSVPVLPAAAVETVALLENPKSNMKDIARSIEHDPGLTANVLKLANSAMMGMSGSISSIHQAIVRIGTAEVVRLVVSGSLAPIMRISAHGYDLDPGALWEHAVAVAVTTEEIVRLRKLNAPPHTFTAGLLIDIGKLVLDQFVDVEIESIRSLAFEQHMSFEQAEQQVLGIDHAEVGACLLDHWHVPSSIVEIVRWHHEPQNVSGDQSLVADLVHTADQLMTMCGIGGGVDGMNYHTCGSSLSRFNLRESEVEFLMSRSIEVFHQVKSRYIDAA